MIGRTSGFFKVLVKLTASLGIIVLLSAMTQYYRLGTYPYLAFAFCGSLFIRIARWPGSRAMSLTIALGVLFAVQYRLHSRELIAVAWVAFLGVGSVAQPALAAVWTRAGRDDNIDVCLTAGMFPLFLIVSGLALAITLSNHPNTYDLVVYTFDDGLGFQPSFQVGRFLHSLPVLSRVAYWAYEGLPFFMSLAFAAEARVVARGRPPSIMSAFIIAAVGGFVLYSICPVVGPLYVFGDKFPNSPPAPPLTPISLVPGGSAPRNGMPSVHLSMALLIYWHSRIWTKPVRLLAGALVVLTFLATLGFGEHYLADLMVAVPFALLARVLSSWSSRHGQRTRWALAISSALVVVNWVFYFRLPTAPLHAHPVVSWLLLLLNMLVPLYLELRVNPQEAR